MSILPSRRRCPLSLSLPAFGLFSFTSVFLFTLVFLQVALPNTSSILPVETGKPAEWLITLIISLSAGMSAALSGMLSWGFLIVRPWQWLQGKPWWMTALLGGLISLIEIVFTSYQTWVISFFIWLFLNGLPPDYSVGHVLAAILLGSLWLAVVTLMILAVTTRGLIFLGGVLAGAAFALLARCIFG